MIQNIFFRHTTFLFVHTLQWISLEVKNLWDLLVESLKVNKTSKKRKRSLILQYSFDQIIHLTLKIICSRNTAKNLSEFENFPANIFLFSVRKSICTAPFLDSQELHSWSTLKANVCIFLYISVRNILFQRRSKILSGGSGFGEAEQFL